MIIYRFVSEPPFATGSNRASTSSLSFSTLALQSKQVCGEKNCERAIHDCDRRHHARTRQATEEEVPLRTADQLIDRAVVEDATQQSVFGQEKVIIQAGWKVRLRPARPLAGVCWLILLRPKSPPA